MWKRNRPAVLYVVIESRNIIFRIFLNGFLRNLYTGKAFARLFIFERLLVNFLIRTVVRCIGTKEIPF